MKTTMERVAPIEGVTWTWNEKSRKQGKKPGSADAGVIAQDVEAAFPELVVAIDGVKRVNYTGLAGILLEGLKELHVGVQKLERRVAALERSARPPTSGSSRRRKSR